MSPAIDRRTVGEALRLHRKAARKKQTEVARRIGVSPSAVSKWERGEAMPSLLHGLAFARAIQVPANKLFAGVSGSGGSTPRQGSAASDGADSHPSGVNGVKGPEADPPASFT